LVTMRSKTHAVQSGHFRRSSVQVSVTCVAEPRPSKPEDQVALLPWSTGERGPILRTVKANGQPGSDSMTTDSVTHVAGPRRLLPSKTSPTSSGRAGA